MQLGCEQQIVSEKEYFVCLFNEMFWVTINLYCFLMLELWIIFPLHKIWLRLVHVIMDSLCWVIIISKINVEYIASPR